MRISALAIITATLVACGGGSGSDTSVSPGGGATNDAFIESDIKYLAASLNLLKITASSAFLARASNQQGNSVDTETPCPVSGTFVRREPNGAKPYSELASCVISQAPNLTFTGLGVTAGGYQVIGPILGTQTRYLISNGDISGSVGAPGSAVSMDVELTGNRLTAGTRSAYDIESTSFRGDQIGASPTESYSGEFTSRYDFDGVQEIIASTTNPIRWGVADSPTQGVLTLSYRSSSGLRNLTFSFDNSDVINVTNDNSRDTSSLNWSDSRLQQFLAETIE